MCIRDSNHTDAKERSRHLQLQVWLSVAETARRYATVAVADGPNGRAAPLWPDARCCARVAA
eukprot:3383654-Rhodomonas_salina.1